MANDFASLGFSVPSIEDYAALIARAKRLGTPIHATVGTYYRWSPGSGVEVWAQTNADGRIAGGPPGFSGAGRLRVRITRLMPEERTPQCGAVFGWVLGPEHETRDESRPDVGHHPIAIDVPDFGVLADALQLPQIVTMNVTGFARDLAYFPDAETAARRTRLATPAFIFAGQRMPDRTPIEPPRAMAVFSTRVLQATPLQNPDTGRDFHHLLVEVQGGTLDIVASVESLAAEPKPGGIVQGLYQLWGRLVQ